MPVIALDRSAAVRQTLQAPGEEHLDHRGGGVMSSGPRAAELGTTAVFDACAVG